MKKIPRIGLLFGLAVVFILVIPAVIFIICVLFDIPVRAPALEKHCLELEFKNAPEGTDRVMLIINGGGPEPVDNHVIDRTVLYFAEMTPEEYQERYGLFRAAYVDEDGNILGVTDYARYSYGSSKPRVLIADGGGLTFCTGAPADWQLTVLYIAIAAELLTGMALLVIVSMAIAEAAVEKLSERKVVR
ncbi:MAG: hypothetical protein K2N38_12915 [Oscillospiraceae bacterium]|nr:hypothetical protein [Oscillospiraceae bacterium]